MRTPVLIFRTAMLVVGVLAGFSAPSTQAQPRGFPLVCHGSTNQLADITFNNGGRPGISLAVRFKGASSAVSSRPPKPGECAWLDRGWRNGAPEVMLWTGQIQSFKVAFTGEKAIIAGTPRTFAKPGDRDFEYLLDALMKGRRFQVHAYADPDPSDPAEPVLKITRVGP